MLTIRERLSRNARYGMLGRQRELDVLLNSLSDDRPLIWFVHGMSGIGKTVLLKAVAAQAQQDGHTVISLDGGAVEPTQAGLLSSLGEALGHPLETPADAGAALAGGACSLLVIDRYELLVLLDTWLRQSFLPALPDSVRTVIASRHPPAARWHMAPDWHGLFRSLHLEPLDEKAAAALVEVAGLKGEAARRIVRFAHGHPLALKLASSLASATGLDQEVPHHEVLHHLSRLYLGEIADPKIRQALRSSSVARRITRGLLDQLMPDASAAELIEQISQMPFIEVCEDGLAMHDAVREAVASDFEACDPAGFRRARNQAWRHLRSAAGEAQGQELWRHTADSIYLLRNPVVRDAFFPRQTTSLEVKPAAPGQGGEIGRIAAVHEPPEAVQQLICWWESAPEAFSMIFRPGGEPAGFYAMLDPAKVSQQQLMADPLTARWWSHLREHRLPRGQIALFVRRWLSTIDGEAPSPVQAAAWLDIKRHYMALRPRLRRVYLGLGDPAPYARVASQLGFCHLPECSVSLGGTTYHTVMLDMGPASVDGWLSWLVDSELGSDDSSVLDTGRRALRVEGDSVPLTRLEFEVMHYLQSRRGTAVSRQELLNDVWGLRFDGGSNVVDTVVAALRRKLRARAGMIGTVRGYGYVLHDPEDA